MLLRFTLAAPKLMMYTHITADLQEKEKKITCTYIVLDMKVMCVDEND